MSTPAFQWRAPEKTSSLLGRKRKLISELRKRTTPRAVEKPDPERPEPHGRQKRSRTNRIVGQSLPVHRIIETLDHKLLQQLLQHAVASDPAVAQTIAKLAPKPTPKESLALMRAKCAAVAENVPYKVDAASDYSYTRVKPYLAELLSCLSDFILDMLPPIEVEVVSACTVLDAITDMIHELPNFANAEFQYTRAVAYEQLATLWVMVLDAERVSAARAAAELDLQRRLEKHDEVLGGKFGPALDVVKALGTSETSVFGDLITVDYSGFLLAPSH